jgi:CRISPR/Cas system CSM-associated protein Csm3 (group 7 of RAMP superfamily)
MFDRFENRYDLRGRLITRTGLHIGTGGSLTIAESDNPVIRDINGWPYIPGSSFKGALRSLLEAMVRTLSPDGRQEPWACDPLRDYLNQIMSLADNSPPRKEGDHGQEESRAPGAADHLGNSR